MASLYVRMSHMGYFFVDTVRFNQNVSTCCSDETIYPQDLIAFFEFIITFAY